LATDFLNVCYTAENVDLIHYIGSNQYALPVFMESYAARKVCLLDGQGNGMLYLDHTFPVERAVELVTSGATRFNGETCTSVNGVLVEQDIYEEVREALVEAFHKLCVGEPTAPETEIGPLFSREQAESLARAVHAGHLRLLCGGSAEGAYFTPAVVEGVATDDALVRQGLFGPALWIRPVREHELFDWLRANQFPLSDAILSTRTELIRRFAFQSRAARICVNEDPSVESMFEPWGGYPPSGNNPVSIWIAKYRQTFQLDGHPNDIILAGTQKN
jgi:acyl-CoA reductase-like NAD-dependent aldehyde dehydrogenase